MSVDISQLKEFKRRLEEMRDDGVKEFAEECCKGLTVNLLEKTIKNTPVDKGYLRRGWTGGRENGNGDNVNGVKAYVNGLPAQRTSSRITIKISNPVEYAPYVEHGHRLRNSGWVEGRHMLSEAESIINESKEAYIKRKLEKYLKGVIKP